MFFDILQLINKLINYSKNSPHHLFFPTYPALFSHGLPSPRPHDANDLKHTPSISWIATSSSSRSVMIRRFTSSFCAVSTRDRSAVSRVSVLVSFSSKCCFSSVMRVRRASDERTWRKRGREVGVKEKKKGKGYKVECKRLQQTEEKHKRPTIWAAWLSIWYPSCATTNLSLS